jgi:hypothetical protein
MSVAAIAIPNAVEAVGRRLTNIDIVASTVERAAKQGDLIVVAPWYIGVSFDRYYGGPAEWTMLPALGFHRFHRYDLLGAAMQEADQTAPALRVFAAASRALRSGHSVFVISGSAQLDTARATTYRKARIPEDGWMSPKYQKEWAAMLSEQLRRHSTSISRLSIPGVGPVSDYENVSALVVAGWRD